MTLEWRSKKSKWSFQYFDSKFLRKFVCSIANVTGDSLVFHHFRFKVCHSSCHSQCIQLTIWTIFRWLITVGNYAIRTKEFGFSKQFDDQWRRFIEMLLMSDLTSYLMSHPKRDPERDPNGDPKRDPWISLQKAKNEIERKLCTPNDLHVIISMRFTAFQMHGQIHLSD